MDENLREVAREKLAGAAKLMKREGIDVWLVATRSGSDPAMPLLFDIRSDGPAALAIVADGVHRALVPAGETERYAGTGLFGAVTAWEGDYEAALASFMRSLSPARLAIDVSESDHLGDGMTFGHYRILGRAWGRERLAAAERSSAPLLRELRSVKSPAELERLRTAIATTTDIYDEVFAAVRIGMSEIMIGELFVRAFGRHGVGNGIGAPDDPPIVCIVRAGLAHRKPGPAILGPGDILICDVSVRYRDYVSDIARTAYAPAPGESAPPGEIERAFRTARAAIDASMEALRPGVRGFEVDAAGRAVIEAAGYPTIRHSTGHQIGRNCHDGGTLLGPRRGGGRPEVEGIVAVGEVYAIEPTVIQDGGLPCMLVEENVVVRETGVEVLSRRQDELVLIRR